MAGCAGGGGGPDGPLIETSLLESYTGSFSWDRKACSGLICVFSGSSGTIDIRLDVTRFDEHSFDGTVTILDVPAPCTFDSPFYDNPFLQGQCSLLLDGDPRPPVEGSRIAVFGTIDPPTTETRTGTLWLGSVPFALSIGEEAMGGHYRDVDDGTERTWHLYLGASE